MHALWKLTRPAGTPWVLSLPVLGYGFAHWDHGLPARAVPQMALLVIAWWFLHAGTMWLNATLDRDEGDVLYGSPGTAVPVNTRPLGLLALFTAAALASLAGPIAGFAAASAAALSVLYSDPLTAWKGHPIGGPAVNLLGYGLLSPLAGWSIVGAPLTPRASLVLVLHSLMVLGTYFAMQAFQQREDAARGYRTLVVTHGPQRTLAAARALYFASFGGHAVLALAGWIPRGCLIPAVGYLWADQVLVSWAARDDGGTVQEAQHLVRRLMTVGVGLIFVAYLHHGFQIVLGLPPGGLGTAGGHL